MACDQNAHTLNTPTCHEKPLLRSGTMMCRDVQNEIKPVDNWHFVHTIICSCTPPIWLTHCCPARAHIYTILLQPLRFYQRSYSLTLAWFHSPHALAPTVTVIVVCSLFDCSLCLTQRMLPCHTADYTIIVLVETHRSSFSFSIRKLSEWNLLLIFGC